MNNIKAIALLLIKVSWTCLKRPSPLILSIGIWTLGAGKLQAVTENSLSPKTFENGNSAPELTEQIPSTDKLENPKDT